MQPTTTVNSEQLAELLRQNAEMKADLSTLLTVVNMLKPFTQGLNFGNGPAPGMIQLMSLLAPMVPKLMEKFKEPETQKAISQISEIYNRYAAKEIHQPHTEIKNELGTGENTNGTD